LCPNREKRRDADGVDDVTPPRAVTNCRQDRRQTAQRQMTQIPVFSGTACDLQAVASYLIDIQLKNKVGGKIAGVPAHLGIKPLSLGPI